MVNLRAPGSGNCAASVPAAALRSPVACRNASMAAVLTAGVVLDGLPMLR